ncbi:hypothetical protein MTR67_046527 [Solanum verrucosum]|uniref:Uncharacterized protein n=1 Tax=Solanum verrucosum TaxID=315347 RepID=A0AAF0UVD1_SOLVR|nr:hypothetical protein MTR67_046527 [Solanum verrucosum]
MSRTKSRHRYPRSASITPLIQLSTPESVVILLAFGGLDYFVFLSFVLLGCCGVSTGLRKPGQGFAWGQQWSPGAGPAQGVGSGRDIGVERIRSRVELKRLGQRPILCTKRILFFLFIGSKPI